MYFPALDPSTGRLADLRLAPMRVRRFRANRASRDEAEWLRGAINGRSRAFGFRVELVDGPRLALHASGAVHLNLEMHS
jgi:poly-gamma-glutamate capsule biosynthesis protein CapA/YwtB (metallophosphatase superfamily)